MVSHVKILSWNINGIRSILGKGFLKFVEEENPDILCLQETRAPEHSVQLPLPHYQQYWNVSSGNVGYSGTAIFTKMKPVEVTRGMGIEKHDGEGRILTAKFENFFLVDVYTPNSKRDLSRLPYREEWDLDFLKFLKKLEKKKPVIFCGDLNVAHKERDLTHPETNHKNHGFTNEERAGFDQIVKNGFVDTFREFVEEGGHYTWWAPFANCRARNIGWRIDYFCISSALRSQLRDAFILPKVLGSDHCPVGVEMEF